MTGFYSKGEKSCAIRCPVTVAVLYIFKFTFICLHQCKEGSTQCGSTSLEISLAIYLLTTIKHEAREVISTVSFFKSSQQQEND